MIPFSFNLSVSIDYFRATCIHHCRRIFFQNEFLWLIILPRFLFSIYQFSLVVILLPGIGQYFRSYSVVYQFWEWVIFGSGMFLKGLLWYYMPSICICMVAEKNQNGVFKVIFKLAYRILFDAVAYHICWYYLFLAYEIIEGIQLGICGYQKYEVR